MAHPRYSNRYQYPKIHTWNDLVLDLLSGKLPDNNAPAIAPFGEQRVAQKFNLFNSKLLGDNRPLFWDDVEVSGSGTGSSYDANSATVTLSVSNLTAGTRVRQTWQRMNYQPGNGQQILLTLVLGDKLTGITRRAGYFDGNNGLFLEQTPTELAFVIRSKASGTVVDTRIPQSEWVYDTIEELDDIQAQILWIDFESLQVGSVRFGAVIDGRLIYGHTQHHANRINTVYFGTPNLPLRYEISNDGTGPAATMKVICNTVNSEGGQKQRGISRAISTEGTHLSATNADTLYALIGIRLKSTHLDNVVELDYIRMIAETNDDFEWQILLNPTVAGTFTYSDVTNSAIQVAKGATANTVTGGTLLASGWGKSGEASQALTDIIRYLGSAIDGTPETIVACARPLANNAVIQGTLGYYENS